MTNPTFIAQAFAAGAGPTDINVIPNTPSATPGRASLQEGFPDITMQPVIAGGIPPLGQDFNGILNLATLHTVFLQSGKLYNFSPEFIAAGGVYNLGNIVVSADGTTLWMCNANGIVDDPDGATSSRWTAIFNVQDTTSALPVVAVTGGTVTLTALQSAQGVIILNGALASNARVNLSRHQVRTWIIVNQCTMNGFTLTVATSAGTGTLVPSGGFAQPTGLYSDGVNVYPSVSPFNLPISVAPVPATIAQRDNSGYLYAVYLNQNSATENPTIDSIFCQSNGDGFLRKLTKANFAAQLPVSTLAGQVLAAQVPLTAVSQWAASIFASAALTGNPTAPTQAPGDSDTSIATTAFANPGQAQAANGYYITPGGLYEQWGVVNTGGAGPGQVAITFPIPFPNGCYNVTVTTQNRNAAGSAGYNFADSLTAAGFNAWFDVQQTGANTGQRGGFWRAVGH